MVFFGLDTPVLALLLAAVTVCATLVGLLLGRRARRTAGGPSEHFGVLQGALIGFMGLVLAFGLSLALGRYETRRADTVDEGNTIGTTYLRAQTLSEPMRSQSLELLRRHTATSIEIATTTPGSAAEQQALARSADDERQLWSLAGQALDRAPEASAPRLYVESLNEMFDAQSTRVSALSNRVPTPVLLLEVVGAATALGVLGLHLGSLGGGVATSLISAVLVTLLLFVTFDLDRPARGLIQVPATPLTDVLSTMSQPPAAGPPP